MRAEIVDLRVLLSTLALLGVAGICVACGGAASPEGEGEPNDPAGDRQAVLEAHQALVDAYQRADVGGFVLMLEKSDDLLLYHPRRDDRWHGIDAVQAALPRMFARLGKPTWLDVHLDIVVEGDVAWLTSHVVIESPNIEFPFTGRGTEVWVRRAGNWKLAHGHWSANPEFEGGPS